MLQGFDETPGENTLRSAMDVGPAKVRRRATSAVRKVNGQLLVSSDELEIFKTFYVDTLLSGALRFYWTEPNDPETTVEMRFAEAPTWTTQSNKFVISLKLEILP
jgi:hypothetical protein